MKNVVLTYPERYIIYNALHSIEPENDLLPRLKDKQGYIFLLSYHDRISIEKALDTLDSIPLSGKMKEYIKNKISP